VEREFVYFLMAYYFHFTPEQVDRMDCVHVESMLIMLPAWRKRITEAEYGRSRD
jgi:hypothetical protein